MMLLRRRRSRMLMLLRSCRPGAQQRKNENQSGHGPRDLASRAQAAFDFAQAKEAALYNLFKRRADALASADREL
jgi:hypothetical protein